jgi:hypothetical protein
MAFGLAVSQKATERASPSRSDGIAASVGALRLEQDAAGGEFGESIVE